MFTLEQDIIIQLHPQSISALESGSVAQDIHYSRIFVHDGVGGVKGRQYVFHLRGPAKLSLVHEYADSRSSESFRHRTKVIYSLIIAWYLGFDVAVAEALGVDDFVEVEDADGEALYAGYGGDGLDCGLERCEYGGSGFVSHGESKVRI
jgi:hypothetical protein